ncbi:MAG: LemA family protein [Patescibacteria group bacterium]|nr:LemA family protein [Patescibacteria group bacterium]MCL5432324.1 LemA family protein [Patescibacteria group bacterium]
MIIEIIGLLVLLVIFVWVLYNGLVSKKMRVDEAASQIDVQLKRRADLIPNLVETVKAYAKHEKTVFEEVTKARSALVSAGSLAQKNVANNQLAGALKSLFAVAEAYPQLRASENFKSLQEELTDTEDKVAYSRQFYNNVVMDYNTALKVFPNVLFAQMLNFKEAEFFGDVTGEDKKAPHVNL